MSEFEILISGFVGGALSSTAITMLFWSNYKWNVEEKIKTLQYQLAALRSEISTGYVE